MRGAGGRTAGWLLHPESSISAGVVALTTRLNKIDSTRVEIACGISTRSSSSADGLMLLLVLLHVTCLHRARVPAIAFFALRPLALKRFMGAGGFASGVEALIGKQVALTEAFRPEAGYAECRIDGDVWRVRPQSGSAFPPETREVIVTGIDGNTLLATPA